MARVAHFDISGDNPEQLIPFYESIFQWKFSKWEGPMEYWMIETGSEDQPGINGGLSKRQADDRVVNTIDVKDIDSILHKICFLKDVHMFKVFPHVLTPYKLATEIFNDCIASVLHR